MPIVIAPSIGIGRDQRRDDLRAWRRVADDEAGHHRDHRRDQHRDDQQGVVAGLDDGRWTGVRRQLQRAGQPDEGVRQADSGADPEYGLQGEPELGLPGIRTGELIDAVANVGADRTRTRGEREDVVREPAEAASGPNTLHGCRHILIVRRRPAGSAIQAIGKACSSRSSCRMSR